MTVFSLSRRIGRPWRWAALATLIALNVGVVSYVAVLVPIMRLQPICDDPTSSSPFGPNVEIDAGEMASPFFHAYHDQVAGMDHRTQGRRIYVTLGAWLDRDGITNLSHRATRQVLAQRFRVSEGDIGQQRIGLPEFDEVESHKWPPCGAIRKLAMEGGEWAYRGPELRPEIARGRVVPRPHLTDPLLFEPVPRRRPENDDPPGAASSENVTGR